MNFEIDYVFPMVNPFDPVWQKEYAKYFDDNPIYNPRHRKSPKLLRYMLRSLAKNMPWIDRLFMVVACPTQVPSWVNKETVNVVLHKDIIPEDELPTFNTCTIDKYVNSIPGLSEHYIHAHDDHYTIKPVGIDQYFSKAGTPVKNNILKLRRFSNDDEMAEKLRSNKWMACCNNCLNVLKNAYGPGFFKTFSGNLQIPFVAVQQHMPVPCVKTDVAKVISDCGIDKMRFSIARDFNDVMMNTVNSIYVSCTGAPGGTLSGITLPTYNEAVDKKMRNMSLDQFIRYVSKMTRNRECFCINDTTDNMREFYSIWLDTLFPDKCKYEA